MDNIKYSPGVDAALRYLMKKHQQEKEGDRRLLPWVVGVVAVWVMFLAMYFGY